MGWGRHCAAPLRWLPVELAEDCIDTLLDVGTDNCAVLDVVDIQSAYRRSQSEAGFFQLEVAGDVQVLEHVHHCMCVGNQSAVIAALAVSPIVDVSQLGRHVRQDGVQPVPRLLHGGRHTPVERRVIVLAHLLKGLSGDVEAEVTRGWQGREHQPEAELAAQLIDGGVVVRVSHTAQIVEGGLHQSRVVLQELLHHGVELITPLVDLILVLKEQGSGQECGS